MGTRRENGLPIRKESLVKIMRLAEERECFHVTAKHLLELAEELDDGVDEYTISNGLRYFEDRALWQLAEKQRLAELERV